jgi:UDP-N-acetylglucosamine 2-epimerase (non-hydrolysing)
VKTTTRNVGPQRKKIVCCLGTRPEAIKMAPVIKAFQEAAWADCEVLATAQHRGLLDHMLEFFGLSADMDLNAMRDDQSLPELTARLLLLLDEALAAAAPDIVLAQGDTTTVLATALACFYRGVPFGHVEAGLRTGDLASPFPEEGNRVLASRLASLHFAPTPTARENLVREGIRPEAIRVVGNPVIDALFVAVARGVPIGVELDPAKRLILVTAHRRESFGPPIQGICRAVRALSQKHPDVEFLWPVHPNPSVGPVIRRLLGHEPRVHLCDPLAYGSFVSAMRRAYLVLTDSGGVQEEAPALGKPVLVLRDQTERPEAIQAGVARLVGTSEERVIAEVSTLLDDAAQHARMSAGGSPYGDGRAGRRIVEAVGQFLGVSG